jgi:hypothetical protein
MESGSQQYIGILLMIVGLLDVVLIGTIGVMKRKPVLILAGATAGILTAALGVLFYLGKIGPG